MLGTVNIYTRARPSVLAVDIAGSCHDNMVTGGTDISPVTDFADPESVQNMAGEVCACSVRFLHNCRCNILAFTNAELKDHVDLDNGKQERNCASGATDGKHIQIDNTTAICACNITIRRPVNRSSLRDCRR
jgi:hypothetical protein